MKKLLIAVFCTILLVGAGIGIWLAVPSGDKELKFEVPSAIAITVGQEKEVEYTCNIDNAVLSFVSAEETIVEIVYRNNKVFALGQGVGETILDVTAKYGDQKIEKEIAVVVTSVATLPEEPGDMPENEEPSDGNGPEDDGDGDKDTETELGLHIGVVDGCEISGDIITMGSTTAFVTITTEEVLVGELGFEASSGLTITESKLGSYTYMIETSGSGTYTLKIFCNEKSKTYTLIV